MKPYERYRARALKNEKIYIALENFDFDWSENELQEFIRLQEEEYSIEQIANFLKRDKVECLVLYLSLTDENRIGKRLQLPYTS